MAYNLNTLAIAPGGLNLLEPSDSPPQNESLDLTDWWAGEAGRLEQAKEPQSVYSPGVPLDGVMRTGPTTYSTGSGNIYRQGGTGIMVDSGYGIDYPIGMIAFQQYAWFTSQSKRSKHDGSSPTTLPWDLPAPTAAPTAVENIGGAAGGFMIGDELRYYVTWIIAGSGETNPSPVSTPTPLTMTEDLSSATVTRPTAPAGVTGWNLYREVGGIPYLQNFDNSPIDIAVTWIVDYGLPPHDDTGLLDFGLIMEANHDAAPAAAIMANQTYNGRIVVGNSSTHKNRIWWTQPFEPAYFRGSASENTGDWVDVGTDSNDEVLAIVVRPGMLVIYRKKSIWTHTGDLGDANAVLQPACLDIGIAGARAVASTAAGDYFVGSGGEAVYRFNNDWPAKLSQRIEPLFRGQSNENFSGQNTAAANLSAVGHHRGRVYVSYTPSGSPEASFILDIESARWFACSQLYRGFYDAGDEFLAAAVTGVWTLEKAYGNAETHLAFQSQYLDCGRPDREKTFADLVFVGNTQGTDLHVKIKTNKNADPPHDTFDIGIPVNTTTNTKQIIPLLYPSGYPDATKVATPIKAFNLAVRLEAPGFTTPIVIDSPMLLHYYLEARRGKTFDSGLTTHGLDGVGSIDQVELDIDTSNGPAKMAIYSDIPGGTMALRTPVGGLTIPATSGRQILRLQPTTAITTTIYGRLFRHQMLSVSTDFQLYGYRVRVLPIGVYLDGSNPSGDFWYTGSLAAGV